MYGCLKLIVGVKNAKSYVQDIYFSAPFKILDVSPRNTKHLDLMLMSSSPGMLDKDEYQIDITLNKNSYLNLLNQAYQRIYPSPSGVIQHQSLHLKLNSTLIYLATPLVPHRDAYFTSKSSIYLEDNSTLIAGEILTCGRKSQEEPFAFKLLKLDFEVFFGKEGLIFKEKQHLDPSDMNFQQMGLYSSFTHQASLYVFNNRWNHVALAAELLEILNLYPELSGGITQSWKYGSVVKLLGTQAEEMVKILHQMKERIVKESLKYE